MNIRRWWSDLRRWWKRSRCEHEWVLVAYEVQPKIEPAVANYTTEAAPDGTPLFWRRDESDGGGSRFGVKCGHGNVIEGSGPVNAFELVSGMVTGCVRFRHAFGSADGSATAGMVCRRCLCSAIGSGKP